MQLVSPLKRSKFLNDIVGDSFFLFCSSCLDEIEDGYHGCCFMAKTNLSWFLFSHRRRRRRSDNCQKKKSRSAHQTLLVFNFILRKYFIFPSSRFVGTAITLHLVEIGCVRVNAVKNQFYNRNEWFSNEDNSLSIRMRWHCLRLITETTQFVPLSSRFMQCSPRRTNFSCGLTRIASDFLHVKGMHPWASESVSIIIRHETSATD